MINRSSNYFLIKHGELGIYSLSFLVPTNDITSFKQLQRVGEILIRKDCINAISFGDIKETSIRIELSSSNQIIILFSCIKTKNDYFEKLKNFLLLTE